MKTPKKQTATINALHVHIISKGEILCTVKCIDENDVKEVERKALNDGYDTIVFTKIINAN